MTTAPEDRFALPATELKRRWAALQDAMSASDLDGLLLTSERNFEYVTGLRTPAWLIKARPMAVLIPADREPVPVLPTSIATELEAGPLFGRLRKYRGLEPEAVTEIIDALRGEGLSSARIGVEAGHDQRMGLPLAGYERLAEAIPSARFVDGGDAIWSTRIIKSELEIDRLATAGRITGEVYATVLGKVDETWTERMVYSAFAAGCIELGADSAGYVTMTGGRSRYGMTSAKPRDRHLERGELFWIDGGCVYGSYFSDYTRVAAIGEASAGQKDTYRRVRAVLDEMLLHVRVGMPAAGVLDAATRAASRQRLEIEVPTRVGHGIGMDVTEPPSLAAREAVELAPGMALAVEVGSMSDEGWIHLEDNVVVRDTGLEFLSLRSPSELPVLAGGRESGEKVHG